MANTAVNIEDDADDEDTVTQPQYSAQTSQGAVQGPVQLPPQPAAQPVMTYAQLATSPAFQNLSYEGKQEAFDHWYETDARALMARGTPEQQAKWGMEARSLFRQQFKPPQYGMTGVSHAGDILGSLGQGALGLGGAIASAVSPRSSVAQAFDAGAAWLQAQQSAVAADAAKRDEERMAAARSHGVLSEAQAQLQAIASHPLQSAAYGLGGVAPIVAAPVVASVAGAPAAVVSGAGMAAMGLGAAAGMGGVRSARAKWAETVPVDVLRKDPTYSAYLDAGIPEALIRAQAADEISWPEFVGLASGAIPGGMLGRVAAGAAPILRGAIEGGLVAGLGGAGQQFAANVASQRPAEEGVAPALVSGVLGGAALGGAGGARHKAPSAEPVTVLHEPAVSPEPPVAVPEPAVSPEPAAAVSPEPAAAVSPEPAAAVSPEPAAVVPKPALPEGKSAYIGTGAEYAKLWADDPRIVPEHAASLGDAVSEAARATLMSDDPHSAANALAALDRVPGWKEMHGAAIDRYMQAVRQAVETAAHAVDDDVIRKATQEVPGEEATRRADEVIARQGETRSAETEPVTSAEAATAAASEAITGGAEAGRPYPRRGAQQRTAPAGETGAPEPAAGPATGAEPVPARASGVTADIAPSTEARSVRPVRKNTPGSGVVEAAAAASSDATAVRPRPARSTAAAQRQRVDVGQPAPTPAATGAGAARVGRPVRAGAARGEGGTEPAAGVRGKGVAAELPSGLTKAQSARVAFDLKRITDNVEKLPAKEREVLIRGAEDEGYSEGGQQGRDDIPAFVRDAAVSDMVARSDPAAPKASFWNGLTDAVKRIVRATAHMIITAATAFSIYHGLPVERARAVELPPERPPVTTQVPGEPAPPAAPGGARIAVRRPEEAAAAPREAGQVEGGASPEPPMEPSAPPARLEQAAVSGETARHEEAARGKVESPNTQTEPVTRPVVASKTVADKVKAASRVVQDKVDRLLVPQRVPESPGFESILSSIEKGELPRGAKGETPSLRSRLRTQVVDAATPFLEAMPGGIKGEFAQLLSRTRNKAAIFQREVATGIDKVNRDVVKRAHAAGVKSDVFLWESGILALARHVPEGNRILHQRYTDAIDAATRETADVAKELQAKTITQSEADARLDAANKAEREARTSLDTFDRFRNEVAPKPDEFADAHFTGGMTDAMAKEVTTRLEQKPYHDALLKSADELLAVMRTQADKARKAGVHVSDTYGETYVPTFGGLDTATGGDFAAMLVRDPAMKQRMGRTSISGNPSETIVQQALNLANMRAARPFVERLGEVGGTAPGTRIVGLGSPERGVRVPVMNKAGETTWKKFTMDDTRALDALTGANVNNKVNRLLQTLATGNRIFSFLVTRAVPAFAPINAFKDVGERAVNIIANSGLNIGPLSASRLTAASYKNLPMALMGATKYMRDPAAAGDWAQVAREMHDGGYMLTRTPSVYADINVRLRSLAAHEGLHRYATDLYKAAHAYNEAFEMAASMSVFKALRDQGVPVHEAGQAVLQSMDFNQRGAQVAFLSALYPFYTTRMVGAQQIMQGLSTARGLATFASQIVGAMVLYGLAQSMGGTDDDLGIPKADLVNQTTLTRAIPVFTGKDGFAKIPVPYGSPFLAWNTGAALMRHMVNPSGAANASPASDALEMIGTAFADEMSPLGAASPSDPRRGPAWYAAKTAAPEVLRRIINVIAGKNEFGSDLNRHTIDEHKPRWLQGRENTPKVWKDIASQMSIVKDLTPEEWRELSATILPQLQTVVAASDKADEGAGLVEGVASVAGKGRFVGKLGDTLQNRFYDTRHDVLSTEQDLITKHGAIPSAKDTGVRSTRSRLQTWLNGIDAPDADKTAILALHDYETGLRRKTGVDRRTLMINFLRATGGSLR